MDVSYWLGEEKGNHIVIDWKPNDRIVGSAKPGKKVRINLFGALILKRLNQSILDYPARSS